LWQALAPAPFTIVAAPGSKTPPTARRGREPVFDTEAGVEPWKARIDHVVTAALSGDADRTAGRHERRQQAAAAFDALLARFRAELRPVLESSTDMLGKWGLTSAVSETLRDQPARVPRSFDLVLSIDRFGTRGPGRLTLTATEACEFVRVKLVVGPGGVDSGTVEDVGTPRARDLSGALVGGLVATMVEKLFTP